MPFKFKTDSIDFDIGKAKVFYLFRVKVLSKALRYERKKNDWEMQY